MALHGWIFVAPVQVHSKRVEPPVASRNSIWIQHWNDLENVIIKKHLSLPALKVCQLVQDSLQHVGARRFTAMHPASEETDRLVLLDCLFRAYCDLV